VSEYQAIRPVWKEQSDPIRLDQLTHFAQYILRQRILPSYFFFRLNTTLDFSPLCLACNPDLTTQRLLAAKMVEKVEVGREGRSRSRRSKKVYVNYPFDCSELPTLARANDPIKCSI
jgi:hypothetical protein